jgi:hypothetical protein
VIPRRPGCPSEWNERGVLIGDREARVAASPRRSRRHATHQLRRPRWWREILIVAGGYGVYTLVRNLQGRATRPADYRRALANAQRVIRVERSLHLFHERAIEAAFVKVPWLVRGLDSFWAIAHFVVTALVVVWLIRWHPGRYRRLRTALALVTAAGLLCFAVFPTVPPRLLPRSYGIVDTWVTIGGIAARKPPRIERISDPFAAMPSLHLAWAVWCAAALLPAMRRPVTKVLAVSYPVVTLIAVLATGNHFVLDAMAGIALALLFLVVTARAERFGRRRREETAGGPQPRPATIDLAGDKGAAA